MIAIAPSSPKLLPTYTSWLEHHGFDFYVLETHLRHGTKILLLCGGPDIGTNIERDIQETEWLNCAYELGIAVMGICRGMQLTNVVFGGNLIDDIQSKSIKHNSNKIAISNTDAYNIESSFHDITLFDETVIKVNSRHHQAVDKLSDKLIPLAYAADGILEAAGNSNTFLVQWHPERIEVRNTNADTYVADWIKQKLK